MKINENQRKLNFIMKINENHKFPYENHWKLQISLWTSMKVNEKLKFPYENQWKLQISSWKSMKIENSLMNNENQWKLQISLWKTLKIANVLMTINENLSKSLLRWHACWTPPLRQGVLALHGSLGPPPPNRMQMHARNRMPTHARNSCTTHARNRRPRTRS